MTIIKLLVLLALVFYTGKATVTYDPAMETAMINSPYSFETVIVRSWGPWTAGTLEKHDVTVDEFKHTGGKISSLRVEDVRHGYEVILPAGGTVKVGEKYPWSDNQPVDWVMNIKGNGVINLETIKAIDYRKQPTFIHPDDPTFSSIVRAAGPDLPDSPDRSENADSRDSLWLPPHLRTRRRSGSRRPSDARHAWY